MRHGKIARLPIAIREELNRRMLDNQSSGKICDWLNALPEVKALCEEYPRYRRSATPAPIDRDHLSRWRHGGFVEWAHRRDTLDETREMAKWSVQLAKAGGNNQLSDAAAIILSGQILQVLEGIARLRRNAASKTLRPRQLAEITESVKTLSHSLSSIRSGDHSFVRLTQKQKQLAQRDELIAMDRERIQLDQATIVLKTLADARAKEIEAMPVSYEEKLNLLGKHMFGDLWKGCQPATPEE